MPSIFTFTPLLGKAEPQTADSLDALLPLIEEYVSDKVVYVVTEMVFETEGGRHYKDPLFRTARVDYGIRSLEIINRTAEMKELIEGREDQDCGMTYAEYWADEKRSIERRQ